MSRWTTRRVCDLGPQSGGVLLLCSLLLVSSLDRWVHTRGSKPLENERVCWCLGVFASLGCEQASMEKTTQRFQRIATTLADLNAEGLNAQTVNDLLTMYVGATSQHVLRMSFVPEREAQNFDTQVTAFWSHRIQLGGRTWCGLCRSVARCSSMACFAIGHSHIDGNHPVTRHRHPFQHGTTTQSPTCSTSNHTLTADEQASLPTQATWRCPSPKKPHKRSESPQSNDISTSNLSKASLPHLLTVRCSSHNPPHTPELTS